MVVEAAGGRFILGFGLSLLMLLFDLSEGLLIPLGLLRFVDTIAERFINPIYLFHLLLCIEIAFQIW
jgi:hypothetical protein